MLGKLFLANVTSHRLDMQMSSVYVMQQILLAGEPLATLLALLLQDLHLERLQAMLLFHMNPDLVLAVEHNFADIALDEPVDRKRLEPGHFLVFHLVHQLQMRLQSEHICESLVAFGARKSRVLLHVLRVVLVFEMVVECGRTFEVSFAEPAIKLLLSLVCYFRGISIFVNLLMYFQAVVVGEALAAELTDVTFFFVLQHVTEEGEREQFFAADFADLFLALVVLAVVTL